MAEGAAPAAPGGMPSVPLPGMVVDPEEEEEAQAPTSPPAIAVPAPVSPATPSPKRPLRPLLACDLDEDDGGIHDATGMLGGSAASPLRAPGGAGGAGGASGGADRGSTASVSFAASPGGGAAAGGAAEAPSAAAANEGPTSPSSAAGAVAGAGAGAAAGAMSTTESGEREKAAPMLQLSERAKFETRLLDVLPNREFVLDDDGRVLPDDSAQVNEAIGRRAGDEQVEDLLPVVRANIARALASKGDDASMWMEKDNRAGSEPRPSVARTPARRRKESETPGEEGEAEGEDGKEGEGGPEDFLRDSIDDRYKQLCRRLHLPVSPIACRALQAIGIGGGEALPKDFSGRGYLGNRGAQAVFLAIGYCELLDGGTAPVEAFGGEDAAVAALEELKDLKRLELPAQGIANEAAAALADVLPQFPSLVLLDLSRNRIAEKGAHRLLQAVEQHPKLREVRIDGNPVPSWIRVRLAELLAKRHAQSVARMTTSRSAATTATVH